MTEVRFDGGDSALDAVVVANVEGGRKCLPPQRLDLIGKGRERLFVATRHSDIRACTRQSAGKVLTKAAAGSGDQRHSSR